MEDLSEQKSRRFWLCAMQCHCRYIFMTLMAILFVVNGCYGDQNDRFDINTGTSQVQFENQRQLLDYKLTLQNTSLLRDETIKSDDELIAAASSSSSSSQVPLQPPSLKTQSAQVLMNKSKRHGRTSSSSSIVKTTTANNRFDRKRDQHRKVHQSHNKNGNVLALDLKRITATQQKNEFKNITSDRNRGHRGIFNSQTEERVPNSKPKIISKLFNAPSYDQHRTTTYLSYNLVRNNVQKTNERFMPTSYERTFYPSQIKQTNKNFVYKSYYPSIQRNNCNKCRIIPGTPIRHKPYFPTRTRYQYGTYVRQFIYGRETHSRRKL